MQWCTGSVFWSPIPPDIWIWISFPFQPDPGHPNEIKCGHAKNLDYGTGVVWGKITIFRNRITERALYNLPWRASVSSHQVQCNIPTFKALLRKYTCLCLERCRKSNNIWLRALMQSDWLYSSLFFEHFNRILLCDWVIELCSTRLIDGVSCQLAFTFYLDLTNLGIGALLRSSFVTSVTC